MPHIARRFFSLIALGIVIPTACTLQQPIRNTLDTDPPAVLTTAFAPWDPQHMTYTENGIAVFSRLSVIDMDAMASFIQTGWCPLAVQYPATIGNVRHVALLDARGKQGRIFEHTTQLCARINRMHTSDIPAFLRIHTKTY